MIDNFDKTECFNPKVSFSCVFIHGNIHGVFMARRTIPIIHVHLVLRKLFITLVWNVFLPAPFSYKNMLPVLFCVTMSNFNSLFHY